MHIGALLTRHARYRPDHLALAVGGQRLSYRDLNARVNRLANALLAAGLRKGDKVATVLPNGLELMMAYWAVAKTGLVIVPCSPLLQESGLATLLNDSDTSLVLADAGSAATLNRIREQLPAIRADRYVSVGEGSPPGFWRYADFVATAADGEPPDAHLESGDVYNIMYSSGTTGTPKGIVHTHAVRANYCTLFAAAWRMTPESVVLHAGSIVFNGAMLTLMPWMFLGCSYVLHEAFDAEAVIDAIEREEATHVLMVPSQIVAILNSPAFRPKRLRSLEMLQSLGAPLLLEYKNRINEFLPGRFYELYGLTEGFVTILDKNDNRRKTGSVGVPPPFMELRILDEDGRECGVGQIGEICGRGPIMMPGYYKRPDLTEKAIVDGWLHSGDAGYVDEDGYLFLVDRIKDMIISGGLNVYPRDIEEIIVRHPAINEVAVFGVADDRWGETPIAAVTLRPGAETTAAELKDWINGRVDAKFQRVSDVVILDAFPRNVAGKTLKREMRERYRRN